MPIAGEKQAVFALGGLRAESWFDVLAVRRKRDTMLRVPLFVKELATQYSELSTRSGGDDYCTTISAWLVMLWFLVFSIVSTFN